MRRSAMNCAPTQVHLLMIDLDETPVIDPGNGMLGAFIWDKVATDVSDSIDEVRQHNLIDALARLPVYVLQKAVTRSHDHVLGAILVGIIAGDSDDGAAKARQYILVNAM